MKSLLHRITIDPDICNGKPCIRHRRLTVRTLLGLMAGGETEAELMQDYPFLEKEDFLAVLEYAHRLAGGETVPFAKTEAA